MDQRREIISSSTTGDHKRKLNRTVSNRELRQIFEGGVDANTLPEKQFVYELLIPGASASFLAGLHHEINGIFAGETRGFRESWAKYHDLRHTRNVALATLRLFHGLECEGVHLPPDVIRLGIICAYFHDTGMLLTDRDKESSGAAYLRNHEERSINFLRDYLDDHDYPADYGDNCASIIECTNLTIDPADIGFASPELELAGHVLGTADILAQMADRYYLESLPLLYIEQQDAGIRHHPSLLALMRQTTTFYHEVIEQRLHVKFGNISRYMRSHFRVRWQLDRDLYSAFIEKNISYLEDVLRWHDSGQGEMSLYLRRRQPTVR